MHTFLMVLLWVVLGLLALLAVLLIVPAAVAVEYKQGEFTARLKLLGIFSFRLYPMKEKADRKKTMGKEKIMRNVKRCVAGVIALAIVGWFGYSAYDLHSSNQERAVAEVNYDSVKDYLSTLSAE